jgi:hypothetical protein
VARELDAGGRICTRTGATSGGAAGPASAAGSANPDGWWAGLGLADRREDIVALMEAAGERRTAIRALATVYGDNWARVPEALDSAIYEAERVLTRATPQFPGSSVLAVDLVEQYHRFLDATDAFVQQIEEPLALMGEVLTADLTVVPLADLRALTKSVLGLVGAPPPDPTWAPASAAARVRTALRALRPRLYEVASLHRSIYNEFTDGVWAVDERVLLSGSIARWHWVRRNRARRTLASVSRSGRPPTDLDTVLTSLKRASILRQELDSGSGLLAGTLGWFYRGPFTDVDEAATALQALEAFQLAATGRVDDQRVERLLAAEAFTTPEVVEPARHLTTAVDQWLRAARAAGVRSAEAATCRALADWHAAAGPALTLLSAAHRVTEPYRSEDRTIFELTNDLLTRGRVARANNRLAAAAPWLAPIGEGSVQEVLEALDRVVALHRTYGGPLPEALVDGATTESERP